MQLGRSMSQLAAAHYFEDRQIIGVAE